jgi:hypothetical protein
MFMAWLTASCIGPVERDLIARSEIWHFSKASLNQILVAKLPRGSNGPNAVIKLSPPTGWQFDLWKLFRDVAVWDNNVFSAADYARYLYCFLGQPTDFARKTNVQNATLTVRIFGSDLLASVPVDRIFYRRVDKVIVLRGGYHGPAILDPAPR